MLIVRQPLLPRGQYQAHHVNIQQEKLLHSYRKPSTKVPSFFFLIERKMNPSPAARGSDDQQGASPESTIDIQEDTDLCLYLGKDDFEKYLVTEEQLNKREAARLQAQVEIRTNLQQHVPWFLRSDIQGLVHQIDATNSKLDNGEPVQPLNFSLRAFDGSIVEIENETGTIHPNFGGQEVVM